jgi:hypothetical protein
MGISLFPINLSGKQPMTDQLATEILTNPATKATRAAHRALPPRARSRGFLSEVVIDHGPYDLLRRVFLKADRELQTNGLTLGFATLDELLALNRANAQSWRPLLPIFNPELNHISGDSGFAMIGRNTAGEPVTATAYRLVHLGETTLKQEIESLRLFYAEPSRTRLPGESMAVSAPRAAVTRGRIVFSGAAWYRPDYRKKAMLHTTQNLGRALTYTRWGADLICSFMAPEVVRGGVARRGLFSHVEWEVTMRNTPVLRGGMIPAAFVYTTAQEQLAQLTSYAEHTTETMAHPSPSGLAA